MSIEELLVLIPKIDPFAPSVESNEVWWTWGQMAELTDQLACAMDEAGIPSGARIGLLLRNRAPHMAALNACVTTARCAVAFNPVLPSATLAQDVRMQAPTLLIGAADDILQQEVAATAKELGIPRLLLPRKHHEKPHWDGELPDDLAARSVDLRPDVLIEMLSSGTTGTPKRIALLRANFNQSFQSAQAYENNRDSNAAVLRSGVRLQTAPLTHISGLFTSLMTFAEGRKLVLIEKFSVEAWTAAVERTRPRIANLPPAALRMILDAGVPKESLSSLVTLRSGTAPLDPRIVDAFQERYGLPILTQYGATEFAGAVAGWDIHSFKKLYSVKRGSVGRIQRNLEARVVDADDGEVLPFSKVGVLELRGAQLGDKDRWVRTTDLASLDADDYLWIHGRADNAINRGGFKIHPDDVVQALEEHPAILEATVVGIPDRRLGQTPVAAMILAARHSEPSSDELRDFLTKKLLPYQIPTVFKFVDELPRTPSLKPSLPEVRKLFADCVET